MQDVHWYLFWAGRCHTSYYFAQDDVIELYLLYYTREKMDIHDILYKFFDIDKKL